MPRRDGACSPRKAWAQSVERDDSPGQSLGLAQDAGDEFAAAEAPAHVETDRLILVDAEELNGTSVGLSACPLGDRKPSSGMIAIDLNESQMYCLEDELET